jgi:hypothetical protein
VKRIRRADRRSSIGGVRAWAYRGIRHSAAVCVMCTLGWHAVAAEEQDVRTARIVGLGAATCRQFTTDAAADPQVLRDYLAWAQGFMSGTILSRPPGVDVGLDLNPPTFGLMDQLRFLEDHCIRNETADFSSAVEALYKRLRLEGKT